MPYAQIGCSGFSYDHWRGNFYPEGLGRDRWLAYYCENFSTVELNVTFYRLPKEETFRKWRDGTPDHFTFSLKGSRFITHVKRLSDPEDPLRRFFGSSAHLRKKLGVILWQLPPGFRADHDRLEAFLNAFKKYRIRGAFEFRDESWMDKKTFSLLESFGTAPCMADWPPFAGNLPATGDFVYMRRHGEGGKYDSLYTERDLRGDARRIEGYLKEGRDVFIYFNNDFRGYAPRNALRLREILGG